MINKTKKQQYFKIVRRINGKLYSWQYHENLGEPSLPEKLRVRYFIGRPVKAPIGGLLVFDDYVTALNIYNYAQSAGCELYQCTCRNEIALPRYRNTVGKYMGDCWEETASSFQSALVPWPGHTRAFKTVTLRKRLG